MSDCLKCGADLPEGSSFCNVCGAPQVPQVAGSPEQRVAATMAPNGGLDEHRPVKRGRGTTVLVAAVLAVVLIAGATGVVLKMSADRNAAAMAAAEAAAAEKAAALAEAKDGAAKALAAVEKCQSAVTVGTSLDDLSKLAATAREAVTTFERSSGSTLMAEFVLAAGQAGDAYMNSSRAWFEDNKKATKKWSAAYDRWTKSYNGSAPDIEDFRNDKKVQKLWSDADSYIEQARAAFESETEGAAQP